MENPIRGIFQYGARKARFPNAFIFKHLCARKLRYIPAPPGHLEFFKVPLRRAKILRNLAPAFPAIAIPAMRALELENLASQRGMQRGLRHISAHPAELLRTLPQGNLEKSLPWDLSRRRLKNVVSRRLHSRPLSYSSVAARPCTSGSLNFSLDVFADTSKGSRCPLTGIDRPVGVPGLLMAEPGGHIGLGGQRPAVPEALDQVGIGDGCGSSGTTRTNEETAT